MEALVNLKWWCFNQNNSGGDFDEDDNVAHHLYVQAVDVAHAVARAEKITENQSYSCPCCGDRWSFWYADEDDGYDTPMNYGKPPEATDMWMARPNRFHYLDGRVTKLYENT